VVSRHSVRLRRAAGSRHKLPLAHLRIPDIQQGC
jgi:hypothetical protein